MKFHSLRFTTALFAILPAVFGPMSTRAQIPEAQAVTALENAWGAASIRRDGATVGRMLSPDFTFVTADGKLQTKAQLIAAINADTVQYVRGSNTAMSARVHGGAVVITGVWTATVKTASGTSEKRFRWTDTWVRNPDGGWMCIAGQSSRIVN